MCVCVCSRVHITEATLKHLNKAYEVEEGNGHLRDTYLKELHIKTYLVIDPRVSIYRFPFKVLYANALVCF